MAGSIFEAVRRGAGQITHRFLYGDSFVDRSLVGSVLPYDVRYALRYQEAELGAAHLRSLVEAGHIDESIYLVTKALHAKPLAQQQFLESVVDTTLAHPSDSLQARSIVLTGITNLDNTVTVKATKLAQLNRQGFSFWEQAYTDEAERLFQEGKSPVLVAYATLVGLRPFVRQYQKAEYPSLQILAPTLLLDDNTDLAGYEIHLDKPAGQRVAFLTKADYQKPENFFILDDTTQDEADLQLSWEFMHGSKIPIDPAKAKVICRVTSPQNGSLGYQTPN